MNDNERDDVLERYVKSLKSLKLTRVQIALYNIFLINAEIQNNWIHIENRLDLSNKEDHYLSDTIKYYCLIQVCSFLEEYKIIEAESRKNDKLKRTAYILAPGIRSIRKYKGLQSLRNSMLAHYNRSKIGDFRPYWEVIEREKFPKSGHDIDFILDLITGIGNKLYQRHAEDIVPALHKLEMERIESLKKSFHIENYIKTKEDYLSKKQEIVKEIIDREMEPTREYVENHKREIIEKYNAVKKCWEQNMNVNDILKEVDLTESQINQIIGELETEKNDFVKS